MSLLFDLGQEIFATTRTYLFPRGVRGRGPKMSTPKRSHTAPTIIRPSGALAFLPWISIRGTFITFRHPHIYVFTDTMSIVLSLRGTNGRRIKCIRKLERHMHQRQRRSDFCLIQIGAAWEKTERRGRKSARHGLQNRRGMD